MAISNSLLGRDDAYFEMLASCELLLCAFKVCIPPGNLCLGRHDSEFQHLEEGSSEHTILLTKQSHAAATAHQYRHG